MKVNRIEITSKSNNPRVTVTNPSFGMKGLAGYKLRQNENTLELVEKQQEIVKEMIVKTGQGIELTKKLTDLIDNLPPCLKRKKRNKKK